MKGKISKQLERILADPKGRDQLKEHLIRGENGRVVVGNQTFRVEVGVRKSEVAAASFQAKRSAK